MTREEQNEMLRALAGLVERLTYAVKASPADKRARYALGHARSALTNARKALDLAGLNAPAASGPAGS